MSDGTFYGYILLLVVSGITLSVLAARGFGQSTGARVLDAVFSVGFLGYAFYLLFVFDGGQVRILFYAFVVPIAAVVKVIKDWKAQQEAAQQWAAQHWSQQGAAQQGAAQQWAAQQEAHPGAEPAGQHVPSAHESVGAPIAGPYSAPVLTGRIGHPAATSPYGRYTPGEPIGFPPPPSPHRESPQNQVPQVQMPQAPASQ
jgi:hypothetical protein